MPVVVSVDLPLDPIPAEDREQLAGIYETLARAVEYDGAKSGEPVIKDTADFRERHANTLRFARPPEKVGIYPGLGEAIDAVFAERLGGLDVAPVTAEVRAAIVKACRDIAEGFKHG